MQIARVILIRIRDKKSVDFEVSRFREMHGRSPSCGAVMTAINENRPALIRRKKRALAMFDIEDI
jgi:hypothetical protein